MGRTVRIGFVGTGGIAGAHIGRLVDIPEAQIVALCDIDEARVRAKAEPLGAAVYTDSKKMLDEVKLDALYVCVPPHVHGDVELRAAAKGIHLFVEKPVNLYMDKALEAWKAIRKAGVMTQVGYSMRYLPGAMRLKSFLADKPVGTAHIFRWSGMPGTPWWRVYDQSGGQLVEQTTHQVDLLRWVMGEIDAVAASYSFKRLLPGEPNMTIPDAQAALLLFRSGASATVSTGCAAGKGYLGGMHFLIPNARVSLDGDNLSVQPEDAYPVPPAPREVVSIDAAFVRAVLNDQPGLLRSDFRDALVSAAVTLAANRSAEEGGRLVKLAELLGEDF
ncbi:MAG: Gfo/Idh/MocA family oxidoreductase [Planctomycetota bacterium]|nr:Gfo/Idh/MocA family oxidoreductase [Planctomycetota bacterium]